MKLRVGSMMGCHAATREGEEGEEAPLCCRNFAVIRGEQGGGC
jgi:hypothetical protein